MKRVVISSLILSTLTFADCLKIGDMPINDGWNLLGYVSVFNQSNCSNSIIWTFKDNKWVKNPVSIKQGQGFWLKKVDNSNWMADEYIGESSCENDYDGKWSDDSEYDKYGNNHSLGYGCIMNWHKAKEYCEAKGGRLPTVEELKQTYLNDGGDNKEIPNEFNHWYYWSSNYHGNYAYYFLFYSGLEYNYVKNYYAYVRCVEPVF